MADKMEIMLELEKRGALPQDKQTILSELRNRGAIPEISEPAKQRTQFEVPPAQWKQTLVDILRPILETGGAIGGGVVGTGGGLPTGPGAALTGLAGVGGGYAAGSATADVIERALGTKPPIKSIPEAIQEVGEKGEEGLKYGLLTQLTGAVAKPIGKAIGKVAESGAKRLYASALKPPPQAFSLAQREAALKTGLEQAVRGKGIVAKTPIEKILFKESSYRPTQKHLNRLNDKITQLVETADDVVKTASKTGDTIKSETIISKLDNLKEVFKNDPFGKSEKFKAIDEIKKAFVKEHGTEIPVDKALDIKKFVYKVASKYYPAGEPNHPLIVQGQKEIARAIKTELESLYPVSAPYNKEASKLINFGKILERAIPRVENREIFSIYDYLTPVATTALTGTPSSAVLPTIANKLLTGAQAKSIIAKEIMKAKTPTPIKNAMLKGLQYYIIPQNAPSMEDAYSALLERVDKNIPQPAPKEQFKPRLGNSLGITEVKP